MGQWFGRNQQRQTIVAAVLGGVAAIGMGFASLAEAAQLQSWRYSPAQNRLEFTTDEGIRPRVQIIPNPVRLVIDLPGVQLNRPTVTQTYGATVRSVRVGQFDAQTARIVVEIAPGYTVDPSLVKVSGSSPTAWAVDLPTPVALPSTPDDLQSAATPEATIATPTPRGSVQSSRRLPPPSLPSRNLDSPDTTRPGAGTIAATPVGSNILEDILVTPDGLFLKTPAAVSGTDIRRRGREVTITLNGVVVSSQLAKSSYQMNYHGIRRISVRQLSAQPPVAQVTLQVDRQSPAWVASASRFGSVVLLPQGGVASRLQRPSATLSVLGNAVSPASTSPGESPRNPFGQTNSQSIPNPQAATIQNLALGGSQFLIQTDQPLVYTSGWEQSRYRITLQNARSAPRLRLPQTGVGSALSNVTLRQDGRNLSILVTPAPGVRIGGVSRPDSQTAVLNLVRSGSTAVFSQPFPQSSSSVLSQPTLPTPIGRSIVVIDPGHGGPDPGAVGIGGLRETDVVLPISLEVARLLQGQGLQVYLTRTDESRDVDLPPRVALAERVRANVFVSIHANAISLSRPDVNGVEMYHAPGSASGAALGQVLLNSIMRSINIPNRGLRAARFYVVRNTSMPAVLVETGFVTGAQDAPRLADPNFQNQMAAAIARGIIEFLNRR